MANSLLLLFILNGVCAGFLNAQGLIRATNLLEFQLGNLPPLEPKNQSSLYDRLDISYRYKSFGLDAMVEQYYPSFGDDIDYTRLSQFKFRYKSDLLDLEVGNLYTSLGRGLLLRTYEIPGSIWETRGYRVRYGFYKDLLGAAVTLNYKNVELKVLRGKVLDVALPPILPDRRPDLTEGIEAGYRLKKQSFGLIFMRNFTRNDASNTYLSAYYDGMLSKNISFYGELAKQIEKGVGIYSFSGEAGYAGYAGVNFSVSNLGISLEYKDYHDFSVGTGINDPPTLVKEHSYRLLNRSTHVPILTDESGYQAELYYRLSNGGLITLNTARSRNEIMAGYAPVFQEYFIEYQFHFNDKLFIKIFSDYARDPFENENDRLALGGNVDIEHKKLISTAEIEWQYIQREGAVMDDFSNIYFNYTLSKASKYSASALVEFTQDPFLLVDNKTYNIYPSVSFTYRPQTKHSISLFYGKRRGGPACNSGVCYDVLDFEGFELRLTTRI